MPALFTAAESIAGDPFDRMAVLRPAALSLSKHRRHLREYLEREEETHQLFPQRRIVDSERLEGVVESIARDLPKSACRFCTARSQVYWSCLSRQRTVSRSQSGPSSSRQRDAAEA
jgi:hypothetical protein